MNLFKKLPKAGRLIEVISAPDQKGSDAFVGYKGRAYRGTTDSSIFIEGGDSVLVIPAIGIHKFKWRYIEDEKYSQFCLDLEAKVKELKAEIGSLKSTIYTMHDDLAYRRLVEKITAKDMEIAQLRDRVAKLTDDYKRNVDAGTALRESNRELVQLVNELHEAHLGIDLKYNNINSPLYVKALKAIAPLYSKHKPTE